MLKNVYISITFTLLSCAQIYSASEIITQAQKDIMLEVNKALMLKIKAEKKFNNILPNTYETIKQKCLDLVIAIAKSPEFASTVEQVTDEQVRLIIEEQIKYNNIMINPSAFPLEQKIKTELRLAEFNEQEEQLFNILYVVFCIIHSSKILFHKLDLAQQSSYINPETSPAADYIS